MNQIDVGYDRSSTSWTYLSPRKMMTTTVFDAEYNLIGDRAIRLLNAAKRLSQYGSGSSISASCLFIRRCTAAIAEYVPESDSPEEWALAYANNLRSDLSITENSRTSHFIRARAILSEVARYEKTPFRIPPTFRKGRTKRPRLVPKDDQLVLVRRAKKDALAYMSRFRSPPAEHVPFIEAARTFAAQTNDIFSAPVGSPEFLLANKWRKTTKLRMGYLLSYLYPSADDLAPFLILLAYALAGNADSVSLMRRDAMRSFMHPGYGECHKLNLEKPRAGSIEPYLIRTGGTLSVAWIVRSVLELTESVVCKALPHHRNYAFLVATTHGNIRPMLNETQSDSVREYQERIGIQPATLSELRQSRGIDEYNLTKDVFRVKRLMNQSQIRTTLGYLDEHLTNETDGIAIAEVQKTMLEAPLPSIKPVNDGSPAGLHSHGCSHPHDPTKTKDENGFCASFLWPFNDRHFVFDFSPRPVAFLLRDYAALCEASLNLSKERFEKMYAARKKIIETEILPSIPDSVRAEALEMLKTLPAAPVLT